ncbi:hypothetical protein STL3553_c26350 [Salmonella enterica subsp. enterica serovar Typhimurium str. L-3553]|uniref:Uncharacterized protein n=4 Tax=Salmonella enterica I TaxID=59201 RepID=A0A0F6B4B9_SALT1|nr:hypothetical protein SNSL254_A2560 [Salmonella enterica subsp. enterica serovar Newport str. SL254]ACH73908.1 hypothetical protein SeD_A2724 [Salmonella enterica subsp. enterica serovar Dublin str. CT_02021853]ACY89360.1 hypothetical protein STM14_2921 [Salmonella enterica subsp. enterica serovar Typhimurium str. 14028S]AGS30451.1 hypothetical protein SN31241_34800 [Salmonella enterica subsp. enterica serovar Newport str. USMARC-S3124.1]ATD43634.1 hypothetical protein FORC51_1413 [Salmonella
MHYSRMQSKAGKGHAPLYLNVRIKVRWITLNAYALSEG